MIQPFPTDRLNRDWLHLFTFGPGIGEGIAVALPERGWILVDGCQVVVQDEIRFPTLEAYERYHAADDDGIEALIWTHPHADHYQGLKPAIDLYSPRRVGFSYCPEPPPGSIYAELEALGTHPLLPRDLRFQDLFRDIRTTVERVFAYWQDLPSAQWLLSSQTPALQLGRSLIHVRAPGVELLQSLFSLPRPDLEKALRHQANNYSAVVEIEFGNARLVLGGDLPDRHNRIPVPSGWSWLMTQAPSLAAHTAFKVSHHGSWEALHPEMVRPAAHERGWVITPFLRSNLPRPGDDETGGMKALLSGERCIRLTSPSLSSAAGLHGREISRQALRDALIPAGMTHPPREMPPPVDSLDFGWGVAVDETGAIRAWYAGRHACTVVEAVP